MSLVLLFGQAVLNIQDLSFDLSRLSPVGGKDGLQEVLKTLSWFVCRSPPESQGLRLLLIL